MCSSTSNSCITHDSYNCMCGCTGGMPIISKKKKAEFLNRYRECLQDKLSDVEESIKEMAE